MTTKVTEIEIDMDGILTDFNRGMCRAHNKPYPFDDPANAGNFNLDEIWGISAEEFWEVAEFDFWANLPRTDEADRIIRWAEEKVGKDNVAILTSPSKNIYCEAGKKYWLQIHYPEYFHQRKYTFARHKWKLAQPHRLLIDDYDRNYNQFTAAGGKCFLFPRPWNTRYKEAHEGMLLLESYLEKL
jgi:hypothetical protein